MTETANTLTRASFVAGAVALSSAALISAHGRAQAAEAGDTDEVAYRWGSYGTQMGFWIETANCVDCGTCAHKCNRANNIPEGQAPRRRIVESVTSKGIKVYVSTSCMHCLDPSCMAVCPAGAITKRDKDGAVVVDHKRCIGCKYCFQACPFSVPRYNDQGMYKCDFCIENGTYPKADPACVQACPHDALHFGPISALIEQLGDKAVPLTGITGPSVLLS